jgi:hypothetical protein
LSSPSQPSRSARRASAAILVATVAQLAAPTSGEAAVTTLGSDLAKSANRMEAHGADSAFWNVTIGGASAAMPTSGQITLVRVKGSVRDDPANPRDPDPLFHVQVLRPVGGGTLKVDRTSGGFRLPVNGNTQPINSYTPVNLCVRQGDYVDFNDIGGHQYSWGGLDGMHVQVFNGDAAGSKVDFFSSSDGTNNGARFNPDPSFDGSGAEVLMQTRLATGPDSTDMCLGGYSQHVFSGLKIPTQTRTLETGPRTTRIRVKCPGPSYGSCRGNLSLAATFGGKRVTLGSAPFVVRFAYTTTVTVKLSKAHAKLVENAGGVTAKATAGAHDDPGSDPRAANNKPPVQSAVTHGKVTLQPDKPPKASRRRQVAGQAAAAA